jgi:hypothetical protein
MNVLTRELRQILAVRVNTAIFAWPALQPPQLLLGLPAAVYRPSVAQFVPVGRKIRRPDTSKSHTTS